MESGPTSPSIAAPPSGADWRAWLAFEESLEVAPGVHRPSAFSSLLASTLGGATGRTVLDAGCGAGLITLAALAAGARQVVAMDRDPAALEVTAANVERLLGTEARGRLSLWRADFSQLDVLATDLLAVNPPQRPTAHLDRVEPEQRHLHTGGGEDGRETLGLVLAAAAATEVRTTAAPALRLAEMNPPAGWSRPHPVATERLPLHPSWGEPTDEGDVGVWTFLRR
jgi:methylase of polypeptide subunit release factors